MQILPVHTTPASHSRKQGVLSNTPASPCLRDTASRPMRLAGSCEVCTSMETSSGHRPGRTAGRAPAAATTVSGVFRTTINSAASAICGYPCHSGTKHLTDGIWIPGNAPSAITRTVTRFESDRLTAQDSRLRLADTSHPRPHTADSDRPTTFYATTGTKTHGSFAIRTGVHSTRPTVTTLISEKAAG